MNGNKWDGPRGNKLTGKIKRENGISRSIQMDNFLFQCNKKVIEYKMLTLKKANFISIFNDNLGQGKT
jgi:hypothetical protein